MELKTHARLNLEIGRFPNLVAAAYLRARLTAHLLIKLLAYKIINVIPIFKVD